MPDPLVSSASQYLESEPELPARRQPMQEPQLPVQRRQFESHSLLPTRQQPEYESQLPLGPMMPIFEPQLPGYRIPPLLDLLGYESINQSINQSNPTARLQFFARRRRYWLVTCDGECESKGNGECNSESDSRYVKYGECDGEFDG